MNETEVLSLIAEGENESVDFKRELDLKSRKGKAELVKDLISLANSAMGDGYLLIGVDDDGYIHSVDDLEEERIQQIAHTYINPAIGLQCSLVPIATTGLPSVGVVIIEAKGRPHKVARTIERLKQDTVFVRRGSVVTEASPEEIIRMDSSQTRSYREARQHSWAAETHFRLGRWKSAITAYSRAIEIDPTSERFLARGKAYARQYELERKDSLDNRLREYALEDFSNAVNLATSKEVEKEARRSRAQLDYSWKHREEDFEWLKVNTEGYEHGEVLCWEVKSWEDAREEESVAQKALPLLDQAIDLGYTEPDVYFLRAEANTALHNYGLALQEIDKAIDKADPEDQDLYRNPTIFLCLRAKILVAMGKFEEAYQALVRAGQLDKDTVEGWLYLVEFGFLDDILCRYALQYEFGGRERLSEPGRTILEILTVFRGRNLIEATKHPDGIIEIKTEIDRLEEKCPGIQHAIRGMVGEKLWLSMINDDSDLSTPSIRFPTIREQIPKDLRTGKNIKLFGSHWMRSLK